MLWYNIIDFRTECTRTISLNVFAARVNMNDDSNNNQKDQIIKINQNHNLFPKKCVPSKCSVQNPGRHGYIYILNTHMSIHVNVLFLCVLRTYTTHMVMCTLLLLFFLFADRWCCENFILNLCSRQAGRGIAHNYSVEFFRLRSFRIWSDHHIFPSHCVFE